MKKIQNKIKTLKELSKFANYSFIDTLKADFDSKEDGVDYLPRQIKSGHYVKVKPSAIKNPQYISHSKTFFEQLGFDDDLVNDEEFMKMFCANTSNLSSNVNKLGWASGYALSIYGTEYYEQCPFQTGNGYGDGRAMSILEILKDGKSWEMQLKGGGKTPYCRGADGRAVLRSSVREFLAQELMYALGIPTSRSLTLYTSLSETVKRPWFNENSHSKDPERMIEENIAICTRVASSFLRVGQLELFARRARKNEHPKAMEELKMIVSYAMNKEYSNEIDKNLDFENKILSFAKCFAKRLSLLVSNWLRVGYCQGNFNSDNCAVGGFTLDYGPFGFIDMFDQYYQPWTGGGIHFSFFNQPQAASKNFNMFCKSLAPLLSDSSEVLKKLEEIRLSFAKLINDDIEKMWASKLGMNSFNEELFNELINLMIRTSVDYTIFFREISSIPKSFESLEICFYEEVLENEKKNWQEWLEKWRANLDLSTEESKEKIKKQMKETNPKYTLREWILVSTYKQAQKEDYTMLKHLQEVVNDPYSEQSKDIEEKYYKKKPKEFFDIAGISHVSCSS